ncbi:MAG TPA: hypothetical protein PLZ57_05965 [Pseudobdellovibrionaceae bacterium]|nr:hypothetical protein [Pseudobdellovibrionaceae bacterium]
MRLQIFCRGAVSLLLLYVALVVALLWPRQAAADFLAVNSHQATLELRARVHWVGSIDRPEAEVLELVHRQMRLSIGPLRRMKYSASWSPILDVEWHDRGAEGERAWAEYTLRSQVLSHNQNAKALELVWVNEPERAERHAFWSCRRRFWDFPTWYHWTPRRSGCSLREGRDFQRLSAELKALGPAPERSHASAMMAPPYQNLVQNGKIHVTAIFGHERWLSTLSSRDLGRDQYAQFREYLLREGYQLQRLSDAEIQKRWGRHWGPQPRAELARFVPPRGATFGASLGATFGASLGGAPRAEIEVELLSVPTQMFSPGSGYFVEALARAWEKSSVILYAGHAGLGLNIDPEWLAIRRGRQIETSTRAQLVHLATCLTYTHLGDRIWGLKTDAESALHVIGYAGGETPFRSMASELHNTLAALREWVIGKRHPTYAEILERAAAEPHLMHVLTAPSLR